MSDINFHKTWLKLTIDYVADVVAGGTPKAGDPDNFADPGNGIAWLTPADLSGYKNKYISHGARDLSEAGYNSSSAKKMPAGSLLFSSRAPIGYVAIASNEISTNQGFKNFVFPYGVDSSFAYYFLKSIRDLAESLGTGTTFKEISASTAKTLPFLLPPLAEQKVIAEKLDTLLAQVDNTKARLERIPDILKRFRQSVLAAAVSGKLTEEWREDKALSSDFYSTMIELPADVKRGGKQAIKGVLDLGKAWLPSLPSCWVYKSVDSLYKSNHLFDYVDGNHGSLYPRSDEFTDDGVLFVTATQIGEGELVNWNAVPRLNHESAKKLTKGWAKNGDVLLTHNATVGRTAFVSDCIDEQFLLGTSATLYRTEDNRINRKYLYHFLSSRIWQSQLEAVMEQSTRNQVSITKQALMSVSLPPLEEQTEIVRRVEELFAFADRIEHAAQAALSWVNNLTQSILAKAFRGELTLEWRAANPELISGEHSAEALLAKIKTERAKLSQAKKGRGKSVEN